MGYYVSNTRYLTSENARYDILEAMFESIRDLLTVKITVPLGNPNLKQMHTNQFIGCTLQHLLPLENFNIIAERMNSTYSRYAGYQPNRWYIEGVNINVDSKGKATMELELNPFASTHSKYSETYRSYGKAYQDAIKQAENNNNNGAGGNETQAKSTTNNCPGGEGEYIDNIVRNVVGNETDQLAKAKLIHNHIKSKQHYSYYSCSRHKTAESCYKNITHLNCADMARLTRAMMSSAGLDAKVVHCWHGVGHFWVILNINGTIYASDNASTASRAFDYYWDPRSQSTKKAVNGGHYDAVRGKNPSC